jgi:hypothetical protein
VAFSIARWQSAYRISIAEMIDKRLERKPAIASLMKRNKGIVVCFKYLDYARESRRFVVERERNGVTRDR